MAISILGKPEKIHPVYNPVVYYVDSTNSDKPGFRYLFDLYNTQTSEVIGKFKVAPDLYGNGYFDCSKILQDYVSYDFNPTVDAATISNNSFIVYDIQIGSEYTPTWDILSVRSIPLTFPAQTAFSASTNPYIAGDQIYIDTVNENYNGNHTVLYSTGNEFVIEIRYSGTTTGTTYYADLQKVSVPNATGYTAQTGINTAASFKEWPNWTYLDYGLFNNLNTDRLPLSNVPNGFYVTPTQDVWLNWLEDIFTTPDLQGLVITNSNGEEFTKYLWSGTTYDKIVQVGLGPNNLSGVTPSFGSTLPVVKPDTEWYEFKVASFLYPDLSDTIRFNIDRRCSIEDYEIAFVDRKGSIISYSFQLKSQEGGKIERKIYNKQVGDFNGSVWGYNTWDAGQTIYNVNVEKQYQLNTNWMTEDMSIYFEELLTSPATWIKIDGEYYACVVQDENFEVQKQKNKKLIRKTVTVTLSNKDGINI